MEETLITAKEGPGISNTSAQRLKVTRKFSLTDTEDITDVKTLNPFQALSVPLLWCLSLQRDLLLFAS